MKITRSMWVWNDRRYIEIDNETYKVPWRYNRVIGLEMQDTTLPIQSLPAGTEVVVKYRVRDDVKVLTCVQVKK